MILDQGQILSNFILKKIMVMHTCILILVLVLLHTYLHTYLDIIWMVGVEDALRVGRTSLSSH